MIKNITNLLFVVICFMSSSVLQKVIAQQAVNWSVAPITAVTDVLTEGELKEAINFSGGVTAGDFDTTVNGVTFTGLVNGLGDADADKNVFANPTSTYFSADSNNVVPEPVDNYDITTGGGLADFDLLLSRFIWHSEGATNVTISGLEVGKLYKLQLFVADTRPTQTTFHVEVDGFGSTATTSFGPNGGLSIIGGFSATDTSFTFPFTKTLTDGVAEQGISLNAFQLREVTSLSVKDLRSSLNHFNLYPNPASNSFEIRLKNGNENNSSKITVSTLTGQVVYSDELKNTTTRIDVSNLTPGFYLVQVKGNNIFTTQKIFIK